MDPLTRQLFTNIPREIGFPWRKTVYSYREFKQQVFSNSGIRDVYTSVYGTNFLINKIYFDLDWGPDVLKDAQDMFRFCTDNGYQTIPVVSGKKGYHLYVIVKPRLHKQESRIRLLRAHYSIIKSVFGEFKQIMKTLPNGKTVAVFRNKDRVLAPDPMICGDVSRITRVPNTLRPPENLNYCTYLPPDDRFLEMTKSDVVIHMKSPHTYKIRIDYRNAPELTDFDYVFDSPPDFTEWTNIDSGAPVVINNPNEYIKGLLRPCLYRHMCSIHPTDMIRFIATLDLVSLPGMTPQEITMLYSSLGWEDFDKETTLEKVTSIYNSYWSGKYKPWKCEKLVSHGIPKMCCVC